MSRFKPTITTRRGLLNAPPPRCVTRGWFWVTGLTCLVLGCSGEQAEAPGTFSNDPAAVQESKDGHFSVSLFSSPTSMPTRGENHVRIDVTPLTEDNATVNPSLATFMPAMGHGSGVVPNLREVAGQTFTFEDVVLNMPGRWELRLQLESDTADGETIKDQAVFEFDVD